MIAVSAPSYLGKSLATLQQPGKASLGAVQVEHNKRLVSSGGGAPKSAVRGTFG